MTLSHRRPVHEDLDPSPGPGLTDGFAEALTGAKTGYAEGKDHPICVSVLLSRVAIAT